MNLRSHPVILLLLESPLLAGERTRTHDLIDQLGSSKHTEQKSAVKPLIRSLGDDEGHVRAASTLAV